MSLALKLVKEFAMMEVGVREDAIDTAGDGSELRDWDLLDVHATRKIFIRVEQCGSAVESVSCVVDRRALQKRILHKIVRYLSFLCRNQQNFTNLLPKSLNLPLSLTSFGFLCAAQRNIHCSVAVICWHVSGTHSRCKSNARPLSSMQNWRRCSYFHTPSSWSKKNQ